MNTTPQNLKCSTCGRSSSFAKDSTLETTGQCSLCAKRTSRRKGGPVETIEFGKMLSRMIRSYGRRCAQADPADVADMLRLREQLDTEIANAVAGLREQGHSWAAIAADLGMSRQAAFQRWGQVSA